MTETITLPETSRRLKEREKEETKRQPPYHVVLHNDDDHTYEYVIEMLKKLFGHPETKGFLLACEVDTKGRVVVDTTSKERAELKQDQIHAYGPDPSAAALQGIDVGEYRAGGIEVDHSMFGSNGVQTPSQTVFRQKRVRIDVENPNPGKRPGQIHVQEGYDKWLYDPTTGTFPGIPRSIQKIFDTPRAQQAIQKALKLLGEE